MLFGKIKALVEYGVRTGLIEAEDTIYTRNRLLEALCEEDYADEEAEQSENLALLLDGRSSADTSPTKKRSLRRILISSSAPAFTMTARWEAAEAS